MRRRYHKEGFLRSQLSVRYHLSPQNEEEKKMFVRRDYFLEHYAHMFIEDVGLLIMPLPSYDEGASSHVSVKPTDLRAAKIIHDAIDRRGSGQHLGSAAYYFFHECAQTIIMYGKAYYEIVRLSDPETGRGIGFQLEFVDPLTLLQKHGKIYQYVPEAIAKERGVPRHIELPADRILTFVAPPLPNARFPEMLELLTAVGKRHIPEFAMESIAGGKSAVPFDFADFRRAQALALADITKEIGWNIRGALQDYISEYYWMHRELLFRRFLVEMRNGILQVLNDGIANAGKVLEFSSRLSIDGVPTREAVMDAQRHLENGDMAFQQIMNRFWS